MFIGFVCTIQHKHIHVIPSEIHGLGCAHNKYFKKLNILYKPTSTGFDFIFVVKSVLVEFFQESLDSGFCSKPFTSLGSFYVRNKLEDFHRGGVG